MPPKLVINYKPAELNPVYDENFTAESIGFRTSNIYLVKTLFTFISQMMSDINIRFCEDGIRITSMDSSHISLIDCFIPKSLCSTYNFTTEIVRGIELKSFVQILKHLSSDDEYIMIFNEDTIEIIFVNEKYTKYYDIKLLDIDQDGIDIYDLTDMTSIRFDSRYFNTIIKQFKDIGSNLRIKILEKKHKISFKTTGAITSLKMVLNNNDLHVENMKDISIDFAISNIEEFSKGFNISSYIELKIGQDVPIEMTYRFLENGYIKYFIAPKIED